MLYLFTYDIGALYTWRLIFYWINPINYYKMKCWRVQRGDDNFVGEWMDIN